MRFSLSPVFLRSAEEAVSRLHLINAPANGTDRDARNIAKSDCVFIARLCKLSTISHANLDRNFSYDFSLYHINQDLYASLPMRKSIIATLYVNFI